MSICRIFAFFCKLISRKCELHFCELTANYPKYIINFTNLSSDLLILVFLVLKKCESSMELVIISLNFTTVVNLKFNTVSSRFDHLRLDELGCPEVISNGHA